MIHSLDQVVSAIQILLLLLVPRSFLCHYLPCKIGAVDFGDADTGLVEGRVAIVVARGVSPAIILFR